MSFLMTGKSRPVTSHNFCVFVDALRVGFSKISSIEIGIETEPLSEGGENGFVRSLTKPCSAEKVLVMERGVCTSSASMPENFIRMALFSVGSHFALVIVMAMDQQGLPRSIYAARNCVLRKRRFSDLDAMSNTVLIESLEFVYETLTEVPGVDLLNSLYQKLAKTDYEKLLADEKTRRISLHAADPKRKFTPPQEEPAWPPPKKYMPYRGGGEGAE